MPIKYVLRENNLSDDPDDYMARVRHVGIARMETIIERMIQRGSTITRPDIVSVLEDYYAVIESLLLEGMSVTTPLDHFSLSVKGIFRGADDTFDPARHRLHATIVAGPRLRKALQEGGEMVKEEMVKPYPNLVDYLDLNSGERNGILTPGGMGRIIGHRLKFDPADPQQGIFFIAADGTETRVSVVGKNKPRELIFLVPEGLTAGEYRLEVRVLSRGKRERYSGTLEATLGVP